MTEMTRAIVIDSEIVKIKIKEASGFSKLLLKLLRADGITTLWKTIYILPKYMTDETLIKHEIEHVRQIHREGRLKFSLKYAFYTLRYGYQANPYEQHARYASGESSQKPTRSL